MTYGQNPKCRIIAVHAAKRPNVITNHVTVVEGERSTTIPFIGADVKNKSGNLE